MVKDVLDGNLRELERWAKGESQNSGEVTNFQLQKSVINAALESKQETTGVIDKDGGNTNSKLKAARKSNKERLKLHDTVRDNVSLIMNTTNTEEPIHFNYVDINMQDGLDVSKP